MPGGARPPRGRGRRDVAAGCAAAHRRLQPDLDDSQRDQLRPAARRAALPVSAARARTHDVAAVVVLAIGGTTDWVDGFVARRMNSVSPARRAARPVRRPALHPGHPDRVHRARRGAVLADRRAAAARGSCSASRCWCCAGTGTGRRRCTTSARPARSCCSSRSRCCCWPRAVPSADPWLGPDRLGAGLVGARLYWAAGALYLAQTAAAAAGRPARGDGRGMTAPAAAATARTARPAPARSRPDFLTELFRNPLDPGYADAAARKAREGEPDRRTPVDHRYVGRRADPGRARASCWWSPTSRRWPTSRPRTRPGPR